MLIHVTNSTKKLVRLRGLSILRFIAAFWIFAYHFDLRLNPSMPLFIKNIVVNGPVAMPFFFMLSGFVLTYRYSNEYNGFANYYAARVSRIYPAYLFCVLLTLPFIGYQGDLSNILMIISITFLFILSILLLQAWYPNFYGIWNFGGTWAISVEMFLYTTFPLLRKLEDLSNKKLLLLILVAISLSATLVPSIKLPLSHDGLPFSVYYATPIYRLPEFVVGAALAILFIRGSMVGLWWIVLALSLLPLLGIMGKYNYRYMSFNLIVLPLIAALIIGFASVDRTKIELLKRIVINPIFDYLGEISYSFFLLHIPIVLVIDKYKAWFEMRPTMPLFISLLTLIIALSIFSYHLVEKPGKVLLMSWYNRFMVAE